MADKETRIEQVPEVLHPERRSNRRAELTIPDIMKILRKRGSKEDKKSSAGGSNPAS